MGEPRNYTYNGIPLATYCKENDINVESIRTRIWKKRNNPKYANYSEQEIVNMVVEAYGTGIKYYYKGKTLRQYCLENNMSLNTIIQRIKISKKKNPNISDEELVIKAIEEFENQNYKYFYQGVPLKEYCNSHPEIKYTTIRSFIKNELDEHPEMPVEEIIEKYINKEHIGIYKYYYLGIPLKRYCDENNICYRNVLSYMFWHKNDDIYKNLSDDDFVQAIMEHYRPFEHKYMYHGVSLYKYCSINNISYYGVVTYIKRQIERGSLKSIDELVDEGIKLINRQGTIYYFNGIPLKEYARTNGVSYSTLKERIVHKRKNSDKPLQEIVDECVMAYKKASVKYYYNGMSLYQYCIKNGINYNALLYRILNEDCNNENIDDVVKKFIDNYVERRRTKYFVDNQSLARFCDINGYSYNAIYYRIRNFSNKENNRDELVSMAIKSYEDRLHVKKLNDIFASLKNSVNDDELKHICDFLKIDYDNVNELIESGFTCNQAVNMIWYFGDKTIDNDFKIITDIKFEEIFKYINDLKNNKVDILKAKLYDLVGIYKSELYDSRNEIIVRLRKFIFKKISSLCSSYQIAVNQNNIEDFESEIKYYILVAIDRICLNNEGQIIKYLDLTTKGYFRMYLSNYAKSNNHDSLDDSMFANDNKKASKLDYIADSNNQFEEIENTSFSNVMMDVLSNLSKDDLNFIMLKYQEKYSDSELADYFNIPIAEVNERDIKILSLLKHDNSLKKIMK